jgi:hypothetical protein
MTTDNRPPIGLMPEWRHKELRLKEIKEAIERYLRENQQPIPLSWIAEQYEIEGWLENRKEEKDWEILSFECKPYSIILHRNPDVTFGMYSAEEKDLLLSNMHSIHSVRRKSDNSIWTIGDDTTKGEITKFEIHKGTMYWKNDGVLFSLSHLKKPEPVKEVLFITEDLKTIHDGDKYWNVSTEFNIECFDADKDWTSRSGKRTFSTQEAAKEWVLMNRPVLSVNEVVELWAKNNYFPDSAKKLAKSKLNQ